MGQGDGQRKFHFHAVGEFFENLPWRELELFQEVPKPAAVPPLVEGGNGRGDRLQPEVLGKTGRVVDEADARLDLGLATEVVHSEDADLARVATDEVHDQLDDGRLARAVRPDQPHDVAAGHREGDVVESESLVLFAESRDLDRIVHQSFSP